MEALAKILKTERYKKIIVMCGAGISVGSGIPDFRSPDSGLYPSIKKELSLKKKKPTFVFELDTFLSDPRPFWWIFTRMWNNFSNAYPTYFHFFIKLLNDHNLLLRCYTQNIDGLEEAAGVSKDKIIYAHGEMGTCVCLNCKKEFPITYSIKQIQQNFSEPHLTIENTVVPKCDNCGSNLIKPSAVFFQQDLPDKFFDQYPKDFAETDLIIIAGTSLEVYPFASLPSKAGENVPRYLINKDMIKSLGRYRFKKGKDYFIGGDCQEFVQNICKILGWENDLNALYESRESTGKRWV
ncbi:NAD-dependent protein deacetylase sirtuin-3-like [Histomonas meleagridis]|uniref:NAD-dependent protein deacetylase sirtuin-3-like n=1 Tax=Histomonas meleagridis TaxID=135588 RepID=UPI00355AB683|nr:NAD-dependent protein deacetylase sirtuin-3-like [Histomonas meleagridis]KAH0805642.1 NAD-dependent protein deacetylase sirtuin-3-like [Histomonas meleagridis]